AEHRQHGAVEVHGLPGLAGVDAADHLRAGLEHAPGVLGALRPGHALNDDLAVLGQPDCHHAPTAASSAARLAASSIVSTSSTRGRAASWRIFRPRAALLPSRRTTSGCFT